MGKRRTTSGPMTLVHNKFKNKITIAKQNFGCENRLFSLNKPQLG